MSFVIPGVFFLEDDPELTQAVINRASAALCSGEVIVFPTDTVYGLLAQMDQAEAYRKIYELKSREPAKPLALLINSADAAYWQVCEWLSARAVGADVLTGFNTGGITVVVPASLTAALFPDVAKLQPGSLGVRVPQHEMLHRLMGTTGPVWATSVNLSGEPPITHAGAALGWLMQARMRKHGLPSMVVVLSRVSGSGVPSRVLDLTGEQPRWIR